MAINLNQLEAKLRTLFEDNATRIIPFTRQREDLSSQLIAAMRQGIRTDRAGVYLAPNLFTISINPAHGDTIQKNPEFSSNLASMLMVWGHEAGLTFASTPVIRTLANPQVAIGAVQVVASHSQQDLSDTTDFTISERPTEAVHHDIPPGAFLIINGTQIVNLHQSVINIGRRKDNHVVIEDIRVSRQHAQLRAVKGRYVIFDLGSTGGTRVNAQPVQQHTLLPGDVIDLSGIPLVYGEVTTNPGSTQTIASISTENNNSQSSNTPTTPS